jgi:hypothetical protein
MLTIEFLGFMVGLLTAIKWALLFLFVFWVLPAMFLHACEEFGKRVISDPVPVYQGRHWRDPQDYEKKMYVISFVNRRRQTYGDIRSHRRV